jgi:hypothetical protein
MDEPDRRPPSLIKTVLYVPAIAAVTALSYALHTGVTAAVMVYCALWRRHREPAHRREFERGLIM